VSDYESSNIIITGHVILRRLWLNSQNKSKIMKMKIFITVSAIIAAFTTVQRAVAQPQVVSIVLSGPNQTNTVQITSFQYVKILTAVDGDTSAFNGSYGSSWGQLVLGPLNFNIPHVPQGEPAAFNGNTTVNAPPLAGLTLAGPNAISVTSGSNLARNGSILVTVEIFPEASSVTNSVTLGPGQGAAINLEGSTDLVSWSPTTNGVYTAQSAMFFRLQLQRLQ